MSIKYRREIDGLRTVAVLSVLIYHGDFLLGDTKILPGGFLGVDIFFVISGFLIASLIHQEWAKTGHFSILSFYERRARRLLPALFLVIFASWPFAWMLMMPSQIMDFAKSQLASIFFISNMFWWDAALAYGARSGLVEPFLHTWSLAVEEQFYIVFPLLYILLLRFIRNDRVLLAIGVVGVILGLFFAEYASDRAWDLSFYWLPSRMWELLAGAVLAHLLIRFPEACRGRVMLRVMPPLGFVLIIVPMLMMNLQWHHPGFGTSASIIGTVLIIWFANPRDVVTRLLSSMPFVAIGLISYSLYLWHYPIFAFGRILELEPGYFSKAIWFVLSFALAYLAYRFVETPFRNRQEIPVAKLAVSVGGAAAATILFAVLMLSTDGLRSRLPNLVALYGENEFDNEILRAESWEPLAKLAEDRGFARSQAHQPSEFEATTSWFSSAQDRQKVLLIGNSHSKDMFNAFHLSQEHFPDFEFARFGMYNAMPADQRKTLLRSPNLAAADVVLLSFRYNDNSLLGLPALLEALQDNGKTVHLMLNTVEFEDIDGLPIFDWVLQRGPQPFSGRAVNEIAWEHRNVSKVSALNASLRKIAERLEVPVLDKSEFICNESAETCHAVTPMGRKVFYDYGHFTLEGARYFGETIALTNWLSP